MVGDVVHVNAAATFSAAPAVAVGPTAAAAAVAAAEADTAAASVTAVTGGVAFTVVACGCSAAALAAAGVPTARVTAAGLGTPSVSNTPVRRGSAETCMLDDSSRNTFRENVIMSAHALPVRAAAQQAPSVREGFVPVLHGLSHAIYISIKGTGHETRIETLHSERSATF